MNLGNAVLNLVPKSVRKSLRESLRIVLQEEIHDILKGEFNKINRQLVALEMTLSEERLQPRSEPRALGSGELGVEDQATLDKEIYATPKTVTDMNECLFYHTMDIPGYGHVEGQWDLRRSADRYLGGIDFEGKRVLEVGTASGFLCFYMEGRGADVVAYDLSEDEVWDIIPFSGYDYKQKIADYKAVVRALNNAFWLGHRAFNSKAKMVYGSIYRIPEEIGLVDISILSSVLLHVRDPFLALQNALRLTKQTVVIAEPMPQGFKGPFMKFLPDPSTCEPKETWWRLSPEVIERFIGVLGFEETEITYHSQKLNLVDDPVPYYTILGHRTRSVR